MPARAEPVDLLAAAHAHLITAVEGLATSEAWRRMLEVAARFPTYSANNVLLISIQAPDATRVCGIRTWNALGRRVRRGEKGIAILAPCLYRPRDDEARPARQATSMPAAPRDKAPGRTGDPDPARQLRGFRVVHVFDQAQTEGEPLPDVRPVLLPGDAPRLLADGLVETISKDGFALERGPCNGANGYTDFATRTVRVRDDVAEAQFAKTLAHELGHIRAEHENRFLAAYGSSLGCRALAEVEAESIAFLVAGAAGLPTEDYSVPYLAGWANGSTELLRGAAGRVIGTARGIVADLGLDLGPAGSGACDTARPPAPGIATAAAVEAPDPGAPP